MGGEIERELIIEKEKYKVCRTEKKRFFHCRERNQRAELQVVLEGGKRKGKKNKMREKGYEF